MKALQFFHLQEKPEFKVDLGDYETKTPEGNAWRTLGITYVDTKYADEDNRFVGSLFSNEQHIDVVVVERILPSAFIKKYVDEIATRHMLNTGEAVTKTLKAQWVEEFINEHLPHAPLKETKVRVCVFDDVNMVVGTPSKKLADDVVSFVRNMLFKNPVGVKPINISNFTEWLTTTLHNNTDFHGFSFGSSCKIYDLNTERKISFANDEGLHLAHDTLGALANHVVTEMNIFNEDLNYAVTVTDKAVGKSLKVLLTGERKGVIEEVKMSDDVVLRAKTDWTFTFDVVSNIHELFLMIEKGEADDDEL